MKNITFLVKPEAEVNPQIQAGSISVEIIYEQSIADAGTESDETVTQVVRLLLDQKLTGSADLANAVSTEFTVNLLGVDDSLVETKTMSIDGGQAELILNKEQVEKCLSPNQMLPGDQVQLNCVRQVKLVTTGKQTLDYKQSMVMISPVKDVLTINNSDVKDVIEVVPDRVVVVNIEGDKSTSPLSHLVWSKAHLSIDGTVDFTLPEQQAIGWLWWLVGNRQVVGFVADDLSKAGSARIAVAIPDIPEGTHLPDSDKTGDNCQCEKRVPTDVTEAELANNAFVYSEDPGSFCKPFSNPERVLSERSFSVIARIGQPEIGAVSSAKTKTMRLLSFEDESVTSPVKNVNVFSKAVSWLIPTTKKATPSHSIPSRYEFPTAFKDLAHKLPSGRVLMDGRHPLQWEDEIAQYQATTVSLGHVLEYRVRWRSNGYSLGTVAKTLTLTPRQTKRIQKIQWERSERGLRTEQTRLADQENDSIVRERDYDDNVAASLREWSSGRSHSDTSAIAGGIGFAFSGVIGGVGGGAGSANSSSSQRGGRNTTASEHQRLRDSIKRHGDALRKMETTVVEEVTEQEEVTGTIEVLRNYNYAHSLTVIYYQILRHLKVNTEFAGARECLFIPFALKPFDIQRAYRWRESIQAYIRAPRYLRALRYLKDVASNFVTSDIPPGIRAEQELTYLRGSIFIDLGIERPKDTEDGKYDDARWVLFKHLLDSPAHSIFSTLIARAEIDRERYFQANYAPGMAIKWADNLRLRIGRNVITIDSTLATRYQFNRTVRVDFVVPPQALSGLTRVDLENLTITSNSNLPPGSVANLSRMSITYSTARFERSVQSRNGVDDLINSETGISSVARAQFPLDAWEKVNERLEITRSVKDLLEHLNEHVEYYHKAIWWRMDRDRLLMMLDGFYVPNTNNVSIASVVDREPLAIIGNCLVYRVGAASFIGYGKVKTSEDLYNLYAEREPVSDPILVSLPTDGLYAQTIMDECPALEEHFGNLDWVLNDKDPELGTIDPSLLASRSTPQNLTATPLPSTIINLQNAPDAPMPNGLQGVLNAVTNPNAFRDMAGLAGTQANAQAAFDTAAGLATNMANQAAALEMAKMAKSQDATRTADQKLASIQRAKEKGLTTAEEATEQTKSVLSAMNPDTPKSEAPHQNNAINSAIQAAKAMPGSVIEANTGEGGVRVSMGNDRPLLASEGQPLQQICGFFGQSGQVLTEDQLRSHVADAANSAHNNWFNGGNAVPESDNNQFKFLVHYWLGQTSNIPPSKLVALQAQAIDPGTDYTLLLNNNNANANVSAELAQVRESLITAAGITTAPWLNALVEEALRRARLSRLNEEAWSAVFVCDIIRSVAINHGLEADVGGSHIGKDELLRYTSAHRIYTYMAHTNRMNGTTGTYQAFEPQKREAKIGDIIVQDRRDNLNPNNVWKFPDIAQLNSQGLETHGDIIVEVDSTNGYVTTVGGNLSHSSKRRRYPIDANGNLVVLREQDYVQEADNGSIDAIPALNAAPPANLSVLCTARIFAVLSPVPKCVTVPG